VLNGPIRVLLELDCMVTDGWVVFRNDRRLVYSNKFLEHRVFLRLTFEADPNSTVESAVMKTKQLLGLTGIGLTVLLAGSARAGVDFQISIGFPMPAPRVIVAAPPVYASPVVVAPAPVVVRAPVVVARPPVWPYRPVLIAPPPHPAHAYHHHHRWHPHRRY
jgi:hypothetical protein